MSERYTTIFQLPQQSATNSSVHLAAGFLLWDNQSCQLFAQLHLTQISSRPVQKITAHIQPLSTQWQPVSPVINQVYPNPTVAPGTVFGHDVMIPIPAGAASFSVTVTAEEAPVFQPAASQIPVYEAPKPPVQAPANTVSGRSAAPVNIFLALLPLLAALFLVIFDPLVYCLQVELFEMLFRGKMDMALSLAGSSLFANFYTNTMLLICPLIFFLLCISQDLRARFLIIGKIAFFALFGVQLLMALLSCIFSFGGVYLPLFQSYIRNYPGCNALYHLISVFRGAGFRPFLYCIWELLYFIPGLLCIILSFKLKRK